MKKFLSFMLLLVAVNPLLAQRVKCVDISTLLENKVWEVVLPKGKQYTISMEFRSAKWISTFLYDGKQEETTYSYTLYGDTIKVLESGRNYRILELTDNTLTFQYLLDSMTIGVAPVRCIAENNLQGQRKNEERLDSIWRKENIWNLGVAKITGEPIKDLSTIELPKWAKWGYDLEQYFVSQMKYPTHLLEKNQAGYCVAMFSLDTLGLPRAINILTTIHKDFDREVTRLIRELPHCLPCRDNNGKRIECFYTVYVPFLPQRYRDRVIADSIAEEELKHCFVEWEEQVKFQDNNPYTVRHYIEKRLAYNPQRLGNQKEAKGIYMIKINSYGEVMECKTMRSCGISEWDTQVMEIVRTMPRWTPTINHYGKGEYRSSIWTVLVVFNNDNSPVTNLSFIWKCGRFGLLSE